MEGHQQGATHMAYKTHLRAGVNGTTACASSGVDKNNNVILNNRVTYRLMGTVSVSPDEFRATPEADRCAHCCDRFTPMMNQRRAKSGKPLYADAMTKTLR
jgi:hypothetical protein